jgi:hypothetical protein
MWPFGWKKEGTMLVPRASSPDELGNLWLCSLISSAEGEICIVLSTDECALGNILVDKDYI